MTFRRGEAERAARLAGLVLLSLCAGTNWSAAQRRSGDELLREQYTRRQAEFHTAMEALADDCDAEGYVSDAARIRKLGAPLEGGTLSADQLPENVQPEIPLNIPPFEQEWRSRLRKLQSDYADDLYLMSRRAMREGMPSFAMELVYEVAWHNPDHASARRMLGFARYEDGWTTPYTSSMLRRGYVWHERFGWLPRSHVARYENGERNYNGHWISAEREAAIRSDFRNAWRVRTEHFEIMTDYSLERGVELGTALEDFHRFFVREFAAFFNTPQQMEALFDAGSANTRDTGDRHLIHYYRSRQEFIDRLRPKQPGIEVSNGLYMPADRTAYFYHDPDNLDANMETMFHEVTHQLLGESTRRPVDVGQDANFWIIEGIACYMESFDRTDGRLSVGNPLHGRIHWARVRVLEEDFYIPLRRFTSLGMLQFQRAGDKPTLQKYYSQATGLAHFFMHYDEGRYRDSLIEHLSQIYSPDARIRARIQGMDELTGVSFEDLDGQYRAYLGSLPSLTNVVDPGNADGR